MKKMEKAYTAEDVIAMFDTLTLAEKHDAAERINHELHEHGWVYCYKLPVKVEVRAKDPDLVFIKLGMVKNGNSLKKRMMQEMVFFNEKSRKGQRLPAPIPAEAFQATDDLLFCQQCAKADSVVFFLKTVTPEATEQELLARLGNWTSSPKTCPESALLHTLMQVYTDSGIAIDCQTPAALWMDWLFLPDQPFVSHSTGACGAKEWRICRSDVAVALQKVWQSSPSAFTRAKLNETIDSGETRYEGYVRLSRQGSALSSGIWRRRLVIKVFKSKPTAAKSRVGHYEAAKDAETCGWPD